MTLNLTPSSHHPPLLPRAVHVHQKDVSRHLKNLYSQGLLKLGKNDFEWLQQVGRVLGEG